MRGYRFCRGDSCAELKRTPLSVDPGLILPVSFAGNGWFWGSRLLFLVGEPAPVRTVPDCPLDIDGAPQVETRGAVSVDAKPLRGFFVIRELPHGLFVLLDFDASNRVI